MSCPICKLVKEKGEEVIYEDELVMATLPKKGNAIGHIQVFPKEHFTELNEMPDELVSHLFFTASFAATGVFEGLQAQGTNILLNQGKEANPKDEHLVIHVLPRKQNDDVNIMWTHKKLEQHEMDDAFKRLKDKADVMDYQKEENSKDKKNNKKENKEKKNKEKNNKETNNTMVNQLKRIP